MTPLRVTITSRGAIVVRTFPDTAAGWTAARHYADTNNVMMIQAPLGFNQTQGTAAWRYETRGQAR